MAQLVNVIAPIRADKGGLWLQRIYNPLQLFATHCSGTSLDAYVACETYQIGEHKSLPYLDVSASYDSTSRNVVINVVNRHRDQFLETEIVNQSGRFASNAMAYEVNACDPKAQNTRTDQNVKIVQREFATGGGQRFIYSFPPHSFTQIKAKVQE